MFKEGDWYCGSCHSHNFAKRETCFRCRKDKDDDASDIAPDKGQHDHSLPKGVKARRGDWNCSNPKCRKLNFASRKECFECGEYRPRMPDEWVCDQCEFINLSFRAQCHRCSAGNPHPETTKKREGDWDCSKCGHMNFGRRSSCQKCDTVK